MKQASSSSFDGTGERDAIRRADRHFRAACGPTDIITQTPMRDICLGILLLFTFRRFPQLFKLPL